MDADQVRSVQEGAKHGFQIGEWAMAIGLAMASFFGGRRSGRAAVMDELVGAFRAEAEATREAMREEGLATRRAISDAVGGLHRRVDDVVGTVSRVEGKLR